MVSVKQPSKVGTEDQGIAAEGGGATSSQRELSRAFAAWLLGDPGNGDALVSFVENAAARDGAQQDFQTVAVLGFGAEAGILARAQIDAFKRGLRRQTGREPVVHRAPMAFMTDAVGILGIALGAKAIADSEIDGLLEHWSGKFLRDVYAMDGTEEWERYLLAIADRHLQPAPHLPIPDSAAVADVRVALAAKGIGDTADTRDPREDELRAMVLQHREPATRLDSDRAALRTAAVAAIIASIDGRHRREGPRPTLPANVSAHGNLLPQVMDARSSGAQLAREARASTVAKLIRELDRIRPQMYETEADYQGLRAQYPDYLTFSIADERPDLKTKVLAIRGSTRHIRLAQELAGAYYGRALATIQDDWKACKPAEFKRSH
jgi:hypothetical protein